MNKTIVVGIGIGTFTLGAVAAGAVSATIIKRVYKDVDNLSKGMNYIRTSVDLSVDKEVADALIHSASQDVAYEVVKEAAEKTLDDIRRDIKKQVKDAVSKAYDGVEDKVSEVLESQINVQTLERIEEKVAKKVTKHVISNYTNMAWGSGSSKADVARACIENGMDGFDVARVMNSIN